MRVSEIASERLLLVLGVTLFAALSFWNIYYLPMNMDESLIYHRLACDSHPFYFMHIFREDCVNLHELVAPFGLKIARPYAYIGPFQGMLYAPFYYLFNSPEAQYWFALIFFVPFAWLMARATPKPIRTFPIVLACMPLIIQFVHDDGILKLIMLSFPIGAILLRKILDAKGALHYVYGALFAGLAFFNIFDKIYFIYLFPSFIFFCLAMLDEPNWKSLIERLRQAVPVICMIAVITGVLTLVLLFSTMSDGQYYLSWLMNFAQDKRSLGQLGSSFWFFAFFWPAYAHHILDMGMALSDMLPMMALTLLWVACCIVGAFKFKNHMPVRSALLLLSLFSMAFVFLIFRNVWSAHHFIYLWVPVLILLGDFVARADRKWLLGTVLGFFVINGLTLLYLTQAPVSVTASKDREAIFDYLQKEIPASQSIVNFSSWGGYYIYALYAPKDQLVTYTEPLTQKDAEKLIEISKKTDRKIYNVCFGLGCNEAFLGKIFADKLAFSRLLPGLRSWRLFVGQPVNKEDK
ncbi:MAG: hypothetical protein PHX43_04980 [Alphaproteobacteria bacterium]|nr:hypothetical protein [Alphaproteobacteria bacterium]